MTFQERWAEGPPVGEPSDLLTREDVERIKEVWWPNIQKLCQDYLTLWDELEHERQISDDAMKELTLERDRSKELEAVLERAAELALQVKKELAGLKELWGRP